MICGLIHPGSGLGNMLHRYIATRIKALELGVDFSIINPQGFKGKSFMNLDMGRKEDISYFVEQDTGKIICFIEGLNNWEEWDKHTYDPDWNFVEDNTIIDGSFEDPRYFEHKLPEIKEWLTTEILEFPDDVCIIGFRGGEYYTVPELGLPKEYFYSAIEKMLEINPNMKFEVHTDDSELAKQFFPFYPITKNISINWRAMRYAKYAIIANSSFYVLPRLLAHETRVGLIPSDRYPGTTYVKNTITIAPRYWNRYNTKKWDYPQGYYKSFQYI